MQDGEKKLCSSCFQTVQNYLQKKEVPVLAQFFRFFSTALMRLFIAKRLLAC